jgi:hypothetical protein
MSKKAIDDLTKQVLLLELDATPSASFVTHILDRNYEQGAEIAKLRKALEEANAKVARLELEAARTAKAKRRKR